VLVVIRLDRGCNLCTVLNDHTFRPGVDTAASAQSPDIGEDNWEQNQNANSFSNPAGAGSPSPRRLVGRFTPPLGFSPPSSQRFIQLPAHHSRCSRTASFRATATTARRLAFFFPFLAIFKPHRFKSVSGPRALKIYCAPCTKQLPQIHVPFLADAQLRVTSSALIALGNQSQLASHIRLRRNRFGSSIVST